MDQPTHLHYRYVIAILVFFNILVFSLRCFANEQIVAFISFAATMVGLVLSVLAIIYAFFSNASLSQVTTKLQDASASLAAESAKLNSLLGTLHATVVGQIPKQLAEQSALLERLANQVAPRANAEVVRSPSATGEALVSEAQAARFVNQVSRVGARAINLVHIAHRHNKSIEVRKFAAMLDPVSVDYIFGFIMAATSIGLFELQGPGPGEPTLRVVSIDTVFSRVFQAALPDLKARDDRDWSPSTKTPEAEKWDAVMAKVEAAISASLTTQ